MTKELEVRISRYAKYTSFYPLYQVDLRIPIDLDFNDEKEKKLIYSTWRNERNVPAKYQQVHNIISQLNDKTTIHDISIVKCRDGLIFFSVVYRDVNYVAPLLSYLKHVVGKINICHN